jgi:hypothetical protein
MKTLRRWGCALALTLLAKDAAAGSGKTLPEGNFTFSVDVDPYAYPVKLSGDIAVGLAAKTTTTTGATEVDVRIGARMQAELAGVVAHSLNDGGYATEFRFRRDGDAATLVHAHVHELTLPTLDASATEGGALVLRIDAAGVEWSKGLANSIAPIAKPWSPSNFRFELGSLPCNGVSKVDAFSIEQTVVQRDGRRVTKLEVPNLKITFSAADASPWEDWLTAGGGKSGEVQLLDARARPWLRVELRGVRLRSLEDGPGGKKIATLGVRSVKLSR